MKNSSLKKHLLWCGISLLALSALSSEVKAIPSDGDEDAALSSITPRASTLVSASAKDKGKRAVGAAGSSSSGSSSSLCEPPSHFRKSGIPVPAHLALKPYTCKTPLAQKYRGSMFYNNSETESVINLRIEGCEEIDGSKFTPLVAFNDPILPQTKLQLKYKDKNRKPFVVKQIRAQAEIVDKGGKTSRIFFPPSKTHLAFIKSSFVFSSQAALEEAESSPYKSIKLTKLHCTETEDNTGDDSCALEWWVDNQAYAKGGDTYDMNEDGDDSKRNWKLDQVLTFKDRVDVHLTEIDDLDSDDDLGTITIIDPANGSGVFKEDEARYTLYWEAA